MVGADAGCRTMTDTARSLPSWLLKPFTMPNLALVLLGLGMAGMLVFLLIRGSGIYPVVFADEWSYSSYSRLMPLSEAGVPSYLYLWLYSSTSVCVDGFLDCARVLNSLAIVLSMPFIYLVTRRVASSATAAFVAIVAVLGAFNTYAIYFMPESLYFLMFWLLTWLLLSRDGPASTWHALVVGGLLGLLSLVKVHALFLAPGALAYLAYTHACARDARWIRRAVVALLLAGIAFVLIKLAIGYLAAGRNGVTVFGSLYGSQANAMPLAARIYKLTAGSLASLQGHLLSLVFMFGLPIAALFVRSQPAQAQSGEPREPRASHGSVKIYAVLVFLPLVALACVFTAAIEGAGPLELAGRLHQRYYNFAFPLLLIIAAGELRERARPSLARWLVGGVIVIAVAVAMQFLLPTYTPAMVDSPELRGLTVKPFVFLIVGIAGILATLAWVIRPRLGAAAFVFVLAPAAALTTTALVGAEVRQRQVPDVYEDASQFAKRYLRADVARLVVVAPHPAPLLRALFHLDNADVEAIQKEEGTRINRIDLPRDAEWALLIGRYDVPKELDGSLTFDNYSLLHLAGERILDFRTAGWPAVVRARGLGAPESWGTWSIGSEVTIQFAGNLPARFRLSLQARAFGPNIGKPVEIEVGRELHTVRLDRESKAFSEVFQTTGNEKMLRFSVPRPVSPKSLGTNDDERLIGIGLTELRISPLD